MRAIDADALREQFPEPKDWSDQEQALVHITGIWAEIDNAPTIELRCEDCENFSKTRLLIPQSEIIRCKDCKHHHYDSKDIPYCDRIDYGYGWKDDDFCSRAERRTDG